MKKIALSAALLILSTQSFSLTDNDDVAYVKKSIRLTNQCLDQLESMQERAKVASDYSDEKIASIMAANEDLRGEVERLKDKNAAQKREIENLRDENKKLRSSLSSTFDSFDTFLLKSKRLSLQERLKRRELFIKKYSDSLKKKNKGLSDDELLKRNIYRIPSYMSNIRYGSSSKYAISAIAKKGDLFEFDAIDVKHVGNNEYMWVHTGFGWIYVSSKKTQKTIASIFINKKTNLAEKEDRRGEKA